MAGIKGQPTPTPSDLKKPVPEPDPFADLAADSDPFADLADTPAPAPTGYTGPGAEELQTFADWAPTIGAVAGGIAGVPAAPLSAGASSVVGAGLGGIAGNSVRRLIEVKILGKPERPLQEELYESAYEGAKEGFGQLLGLKAAKLAGAVAKSPVGSKTLDYMADAAAKPIAYVQAAIREEYDKLASPVLEIINSRSSSMNLLEAGDAVKKILRERFMQGDYDKVAPQFLRKLHKPSEKLVDDLFDPMNAKALERLATDAPEAYDIVIQSKMSDMVRMASPDGDLSLSLIQKQLNRMPEAAQKHLLGDDKAMGMINDTLNSLKFKSLEKLEKKAAKTIMDTIYQASQIVGITGKKIAQEVPDAIAKSPTAKQMIGQPVASPLLRALGAEPKAQE